MITVRPAVEADIPAMSAVMRASIAHLCAADHRNDPARLAQWTANKTPDGVRAMLADPATRLFVAEREGVIAAVGAIDDRGRIGLNYVAPEHRFAGASKALLAAMEDALRAAGHREARLESTQTAYRFYQAAGWTDEAQETGPAGAGLPMRKALV